MAQNPQAELRRLEALERVGLLSEGEITKLAMLRSSESGQPMSQPETPAAEQGEVVTVRISNPKKFKESAQYSLNKEGFFRSALINTIMPNTEKPQMWFVFETLEKSVDPPNRGVYVGEFGDGSGILHNLLDALAIPYSFDESTDRLTMRIPVLPYVCYADWNKDAKAIGGVKISGLKTERIGSKVKPVI